MNTSVLHAMAMESAENVLCGTKAEQQNRLAAAGYDAKAVQNEVNRILR